MEKLCTLHPDLRFALSHTIGRSRSSSSANHDEAHPRPGLGPSVPYGNHARRNPDQVSDQTGEVLLQAHAREIQLEQFGDWMIDKSWNQQVESALRTAPSCPELGSEDELAIWACPVCDCQFSSTAALKTHARRAHKLVEPCENIFDRTKHAVNGLPQCAGCLKKFSRWQTLQQHINNNSCPAVVPSNRAKPPGLTADPPSTATAELHSDSAREYHPVDTATSAALAEETTATSRMETEPQHVTSIDSFPERQLQLQRIVPHGVNHFIRFPELTQTMLRTCMLCGQWVASHKVMNFITEIHIHRLVSSYNNEPAASLNNEPRLVRPVTFAVVNTRTGRHTCTNALLFGNAPCFVLCTRRSTMMDEQMAEFFGDVKTESSFPDPWSEYSHPMTGAHSPFEMPNGKRRREPFRGHQQQPPQQPSPFQYGRFPRDPLITTLAKTVLRQQEELKVLRQDTGFILFLKPGEDGVMSVWYKAALTFKAKQEAEPAWQLGQLPLRMVLALTMFKELTDRLNQTLASQEKLRKVTDKGWRDSTGWRFQRWNAAQRQLEVDSSRPPIPDDQMLDHLATILQCLKHPIVTRFRCKRKLMETMTSQATFLLDISLRCHSAVTMWDTMKILQNNAVFQLVGMAYKTEGLGSGAQEKQLRDMIYPKK